MRRSSIITILLLVIIIIGLVIALIVTNLPKSNNEIEKENIEITENVNDKRENNSTDSINYIALDNKVAVRMATMIYPYGLSNDLFESKIGVVTQTR